MKYVGETGQQFRTRKQQHQRDVKNKTATNGIYNHLKQNRKHKIAWDDAVYIDREPHYMRRKIKESIYINALDASEKHTKIMNLEKGVKTNPCWNEFNSEVRKSLKQWEMCGHHFLEMGMYFHLTVVIYYISVSKKSSLMKI